MRPPKTCDRCGNNLDAGEYCDCLRVVEPPEGETLDELKKALRAVKKAHDKGSPAEIISTIEELKAAMEKNSTGGMNIHYRSKPIGDARVGTYKIKHTVAIYNRYNGRLIKEITA